MNKTPLLPTNTQNLSAALFSAGQQAFHIEPLKEYVKANVLNSAQGGTNDYRLIGIFTSDIDAHDYIEAFRATLKQIETKF